jgi:hypothetical protein
MTVNLLIMQQKICQKAMCCTVRKGYVTLLKE